MVVLVLAMADALIERDRESLGMVLRMAAQLMSYVSEEQQWAVLPLGKLWAIGLTALVAIDLLDETASSEP